MNKQAKQRLLRQLDRTVNDTASAPDLGPVQYMILVTIWALSPGATLNQVIDFIYRENGDIVDVAQAFVAMQKMKKGNPPLIRETAKIVTKTGSRPSASFSITHDGKNAVRQTEEHLKRLLDYGELAKAANVQMLEKKGQPKKVVGASSRKEASDA